MSEGRLALAWRLNAVAVVALLAWRLAATFLQLAPTRPFGTAWLPYSDALGPWLFGALHLHFGLPPPYYLYRPTGGLFWGSLIAVAQDTAAVPIFFCACLVAILAVAFAFGREPRTRHALVIGLGACVVAFDSLWNTVMPSTLGIDLASLVFALTGSILLLWERDGSSRAALLVACLCLGIAAGIRGPLLFAAPLMIAARLLLVERAGARTIAACAAAFLAPVLLDLVLQRHFEVVNNGLVALYCVYSDPTRTSHEVCHRAYLAAPPPTAEVLRNVAAFLFSMDGVGWLAGSVARRVLGDVRTLAALPTLAFVAWAAILSALVRGPRRAAAFTRLAIVAATLLAAVEIGWRYNGLAWVLLALAAAAALRGWRAFLFLAGYLAATGFLGVSGLLEHNRLQHTFSFMLYLGVAFLLVGEGETAQPAAGPSRAEWLVPATVVALVAFLYLGFLLPSGWKDAYYAKVHGVATAALKVGDDARIDRALYYMDGGRFVFVRHDDLPVGSVRIHRGLVRPERDNASYDPPNAFVEP